MKKEEVIEFIAEYLVNNWDTLTIGAFGVVATIIASTWFVARYWYQREIKHKTDIKDATDELASKQLSYMETQIKHKESYAKGLLK